MNHGSKADDGGADRAALKPATSPPPLTNAERACNVGDLLQLTSPFEGQMWGGAPEQVQCTGQVYKAVSLFGRGWDFVLVSGHGPVEVRIMNWDVPKYFKVLSNEP